MTLSVAEQPPVFENACSELQPRAFPQVIKYMGSKAGIIDFVVEGLREAYRGGVVCDLFAGACTLSGAIGHAVPMVSNDIQAYSKVIAQVYLHRLSPAAQRLSGGDIVQRAQAQVAAVRSRLPGNLAYPPSPTLAGFNKIEARNRALISHSCDWEYHLFAKYYSGTWWSAEQCLWIDALRQVADEYLEQGLIEPGDHAFILTCVMHAMAYCGQGTGHYAQYRDAKTTSSLADINIYRQKSVADYFSRKFEALKKWNIENVPKRDGHICFSMDFADCIDQIDEGTVYADPPYAFVHYSRFYHAIETFVLYDYPELQIKCGEMVKGRYREGRHQSPFSIRSLVPGAFADLFTGVSAKGLNLVLSYSNTGLFKLSQMFDLAHSTLGANYDLKVLTTDHTHMTMGRREDRDREVEEALLIAILRE